jgi:NAD-dependent SIR2 family protein deacetylase
MSVCPVAPIPALAMWLQESRYTTVFTGAGMFTESGSIPNDPYAP